MPKSQFRMKQKQTPNIIGGCYINDADTAKYKFRRRGLPFK